MSISVISPNSMRDEFFKISGVNNNFFSADEKVDFESSAANRSDSESSNTIGADLNELLEALESGNLSTAQASFSQLFHDLQGSSSTDGSDNSTSSNETDSNPLARDISELGDAISSGDLTGAQSILANIMQHMQGPPPPPPDMNKSANIDSADATLSESGSSSLVDDLKKLGEALSSGDQASATSCFSQLLEDLEESGADGTSSSTSSVDISSSRYNMLMQNFLQILSSLTGADSQVNTTSTVA